MMPVVPEARRYTVEDAAEFTISLAELFAPPQVHRDRR
jgi:hypothetical protein